jgi:hypothetical protein
MPILSTWQRGLPGQPQAKRSMSRTSRGIWLIGPSILRIQPFELRDSEPVRPAYSRFATCGSTIVPARSKNDENSRRSGHLTVSAGADHPGWRGPEAPESQVRLLPSE